MTACALSSMHLSIVASCL